MQNIIHNGLLRWDITKYCNLNCKHCLTAGMYETVDQLPFNSMMDVVKIAKDHGITRIHLLGGEPTIITDIDMIIKYAVDLGIYVSMNTNGMELSTNKNLCEKLAQINVGISFSIDGSNCKSHDEIRKIGSFDNVIKAAKNYIDSCSRHNPNTLVTFYVTLTPDNFDDDFENLFEIAQNIGIKEIVFGVLIPAGAGKKNYANRLITPKDLLSKTEELVNISNKYADIKLSFPYQTPILLKYLNYKFGTNFDLIYSKCKAGTSDFHVQPDGTIFPCVFLTDKNLKAVDEKKLLRQKNNLLNSDFTSIIRNDFFVRTLKTLNDIKLISAVEPCNTCVYNVDLDICRPCPHQHLSNLAENEFHRNLLCKEILASHNDYK